MIKKYKDYKLKVITHVESLLTVDPGIKDYSSFCRHVGTSHNPDFDGIVIGFLTMIAFIFLSGVLAHSLTTATGSSEDIITSCLGVLSTSISYGGFYLGYHSAKNNVLDLGRFLLTTKEKGYLWNHYQQQHLKEDLKTKQWVSEIVKDFAENHKNFCFKYLGKSGPKFVKFFTDRALVKTNIRTDFLFYAISIPQVKTLSVDSLRKVLLAYSPLDLNYPLRLDAAFCAYTPAQIETIFSYPYNRSLVKELEKKINLPVVSNFIDLEALIKEKSIPSHLKSIFNHIEGPFEFKVLLNQDDFNRTSDEFSNCIRSYFGRDVLVVKYHGQPHACVEIKKNKVYEIKGKGNSSPSLADEIIEIINNKLLEN